MKRVHSIEYLMKLQIKWFGNRTTEIIYFLHFKLLNTFFILMAHIFYLLSVSLLCFLSSTVYFKEKVSILLLNICFPVPLLPGPTLGVGRDMRPPLAHIGEGHICIAALELRLTYY